jgi:hypothetical protein
MRTCFSSSVASLRLRSFKMAITAFGIAVLGALLFASSVRAQVVASRITAQVDENVRTTLQGNTPFQVAKATDLGVVPESTAASHLLLVLKRTDEQQTQLRSTVDALHDPSSAQYHKWLTPEAFAQRFGPSDDDIKAVSTWLAAKGFTVNNVTRGKTAIDFSGTTGQIQTAFHTAIHTYNKDGKTFHSNNTDPQVPTALASVVAGFATLNDIPPTSFSKTMGKASFNPKTHEVTPDWSYPVSGGVYLVMAPGDLAVEYDINPLYTKGLDGSGVAIAVVGESGIDNAVVSNYRTLFGLSSNLPEVIVDGEDPGDYGEGTSEESYMDVEVAGSTAPNAKIYMYTGSDANNTYGFFYAALRAVDDNLSDIISMSYGICEKQLGYSGNLFFNQIWSQAAAQGQSVFVSSGDSGAGGCDNGVGTTKNGLAVSGLASTPYNVAVGGTDAYYSDYDQGGSALKAQVNEYWDKTGSASPKVSLLKRVPEQPWNNAYGLNAAGDDALSNAAASGGSSSCTQGVQDSNGVFATCTDGYAKPSWQAGTGVPSDGARDIPDVSLFAANGYNYSFYPICTSLTECNPDNVSSTTGTESITGMGGTSASTPLMAGVMALIVQSLGARQGNPNYVFYSLAQQTTSVFHDITVGSINVPCYINTADCTPDAKDDYSLHKYDASVGYDRATGLGSIDVSALLTNWKNAKFNSTTTTLKLSSNSFAHGTAVTVTTDVLSSSGTPAGKVSLVASSGVGQQLSYGTITLVGGTGQAVFNSLPGGTYTLTAQYGGDGTYAASTSNSLSLTVTPEDSKLSVSGTYYGVTSTGDTAAEAAPITDGLSTKYGSWFDLHFKVYGASSTTSASDGIPTGTVTVYDNGTALTTLAINSAGLAELQTGSLAAGTHVLTFAYSGDNSFNAYTSPSLTVTITKGIAQLTVTTSEGIQANTSLNVPVIVSASMGQLSVTGTVTVTVAGQSQTVQLQQGNYGGSVAFGYGNATFTIPQAGTYTITGSYSGNSYLAATNSSNSITITAAGTLAPTTTALTLSSSTLTPDGTVYAIVKVAGSGSYTPTGYVNLYVDNAIWTAGPYTATLDATGSVTVPFSDSQAMTSGNLQLTAYYFGDSRNAASWSPAVTLKAEARAYGDYSFKVSKAAITIQSGSSGTALVFTGSPYTQRMTGTVSLTCTTSDSGLGCSLSPTTLTLPSDPSLVATSTLTLTTVSSSSSQFSSVQSSDRGGRFAAGAGAVLALVIFVWPVSRKRFRSAFLSLVALALLATTMSACGGSSSHSSPTTSKSLAAGNYTVTLNAVCQGITHTLHIQVTVK